MEQYTVEFAEDGTFCITYFGGIVYDHEVLESYFEAHKICEISNRWFVERGEYPDWNDIADEVKLHTDAFKNDILNIIRQAQSTA